MRKSCRGTGSSRVPNEEARAEKSALAFLCSFRTVRNHLTEVGVSMEKTNVSRNPSYPSYPKPTWEMRNGPSTWDSAEAKVSRFYILQNLCNIYYYTKIAF